MENKKKEQKENRFTYSGDTGLKVLSEQDILDQIYGKDDKKEIKKSEDNQLKGGKADNLSLQDIADKHKIELFQIKKELKQGIEVEMEHTDDPKKALEIAMDHLTESPIYYTELEKMEAKFKD